MMKNAKRITVFAGHYGSGKTNIAVNYAIALKKINKSVAIADLDIVNPYFRTKDSAPVLESHGITLISSPYANTNVDVPALPSETYRIIDDKALYSVIDVGGDDRGALALGRYSDAIMKEDYEFLFVINKYRPLTRDPESCIEVMKEIEEACRMKFTGIVNNSNLGEETTLEDIRDSFGYAGEVSALSGIPLKMTTVKSNLSEEFSEAENIFPIDLYVKQSFMKN